MLIGSPAYIAPERARGRVAVPASDMWSLGVTMYAAVEGKSPFERPDAMASLVAVLTDEPESAPNAGPLRPVIEGLLRKDPAERLTVDEVATMLDRILTPDVDDAAEAPSGVTQRLPSSIETAVDDPDALSLAQSAGSEGSAGSVEEDATQVTARDDTGELATAAYPVRSIVIVAAVLLVLFGVFVFATFS